MVPLGTLQRPRQDGGWDLPNVVVKCMTLLYYRITMLGAKGGNVTTDLLRYWRVQEALTNPPMPPTSRPSFYIFATFSSTCLMWPPWHPTKQVNISSGGYVRPYTNSK